MRFQSCKERAEKRGKILKLSNPNDAATLPTLLQLFSVLNLGVAFHAPLVEEFPEPINEEIL